MERVSILDASGTVVNVVVLAGDSDWQPGEGLTMGAPGGNVGDVWSGSGYVSPAPEPVVPTEADYTAAIQSLIDQAARSRNYDSGNALATYTSDPYEPWALEAQAFVAWRSAVWLYANGELAKVLGGEREQPTIESLVAELPTIVWPLTPSEQ